MGSVTHVDLAKAKEIGIVPAVEIRADTDLIVELNTRFAQETWISNRGIWVDARDGTIALVGVVNSEEEKAALAAMARGIDGCRGVENHLLVKSKWRDYGIAY